ncbi:MAG TPA: tRNA (adenosine(37)-N6)-threonylcarbamoyltransferase complex dimerization subunit type 1 TsaB [Burkholderiales bacterium]|nr:tRNA (adenosine(37)-N6)-threonylcarbamoyltransferase complex dimerization subunit type 1 TsaB [Burkholderiales bacterium]
MRFIALDSCSEWCSAALCCDGEIAALETRADHAHGELLLPMVERLLAQAGLGLPALDGVAFGAGPGAFTGLRIACGVAQGLAFARDLPVLGVSSLEALAEAAGAERVLACLDARMREVYCAAYARRGEGWATLLEPVCLAPAALQGPPGEGWVGAGSGFVVHGETLAARLGAALVQVLPGLRPGAYAVARLAAPRFARGEGVDAAQAMPHYLRDKVALTRAERRAQ